MKYLWITLFLTSCSSTIEQKPLVTLSGLAKLQAIVNLTGIVACDYVVDDCSSGKLVRISMYESLDCINWSLVGSITNSGITQTNIQFIVDRPPDKMFYKASTCFIQ